MNSSLSALSELQLNDEKSIANGKSVDWTSGKCHLWGHNTLWIWSMRPIGWRKSMKWILVASVASAGWMKSQQTGHDWLLFGRKNVPLLNSNLWHRWIGNFSSPKKVTYRARCASFSVSHFLKLYHRMPGAWCLEVFSPLHNFGTFWPSTRSMALCSKFILPVKFNKSNFSSSSNICPLTQDTQLATY